MKEIRRRAFELKEFDGIANKTSFDEIKKNLSGTKRIDLIPKEMIVKLNIPWGELYCICNKEEWNELYKILESTSIRIKKRTFLDSIFDIHRPLSFFIMFLFIIIVTLILYIRVITR